MYLFSRVGQDESLDSRLNQKYVTRIPLERELWDSTEFAPEDFADSITIFDDCDQIQDKKLRVKVQALRQNILETGRHANVSCLSTSHTIQNGHESRPQINEAMAVVLFPRSSSVYHVTQFLLLYVGMSPAEVKWAFNLPTRWIFVRKQVPRFIAWEHGIKLL